jgi:DNA-binding MurR/RpiR family transcriptional regulator
LRGDKSLSSWLRHQLNILLHGAENRSSRRRTKVRSRVATLLTLALLLVLVFQHSSPILEHKGLVYDGLEILKVYHPDS